MTADDQTTLTSVSASLLEPDGRYRRNIVYTIAATLFCGVVWSYFTTVLEVSAGTGQVVPERRLQLVQNMEGGVVQAILAKRGDMVKEGQVIALLDPTAAKSQLQEALEQMAGLEAASVRLKAMLKAVEFDGNIFTATEPPAFPKALRRDHPDLVQQNIDQFGTGLTELAKSLSSFDQQMSQRRQEMAETQSKLASTHCPA